MARLHQRYLEYRRVGFGRIDALRFAWLVAINGAAPLRIGSRH